MSWEELAARARAVWEVKHRPDRPRITVGMGSCGLISGADQVLAALEKELSRRHIIAHLGPVGCVGLCYAEVIVDITKPGHPRISYGRVTPEIVPELVEDCLVKDNLRSDLALGAEEPGYGIPPYRELPFFQPQLRATLSNSGLIDPEDMDDYIARGGYSGFARCLRELSPEDVIDIVKKAGLRGCGGAAFPAGQKWEFCRRAPGQEKYLLCNADEGNPGTFKDRTIMEGDPHRLIEGMLIAAYAIGAPYGYIYLRDEYPLARHRLEKAMAQAWEQGLLGERLLGSNFSFHLQLIQGAGSYVCGEEMALIASVEGRRGMPRSRPPFPAQAGAWDKPTNVNNVETLANVPAILEKGWEWYNGIGTEKSKGTRLVSLSGHVKRSGVVEVPFGPTLRHLIFEVAGMAEGSTFKAVQLGGPAGDCLPQEKLDVPLDFDALTQAGASLGSSSLVVIDQRTCMVELAHFLMGFMKDEACGKCVPCRVGTQKMHQLLEGIVQGRGKPGDLELIPELSETMRLGSLCGHGQVAYNPALTTLRYFRNEYEAHIRDKVCLAKMNWAKVP